MSEPPPTPEQCLAWMRKIGIPTTAPSPRLQEFAALASAWGYEQGARQGDALLRACLWHISDNKLWDAVKAHLDRALDPAPEEPRRDSEITDDQIIEVAQELVRVTCSKICDDVDAISGWDGDPTDTEKRYKAGVSMACEEIKYRIDALDIHGWHVAAQESAAPSEGG